MGVTLLTGADGYLGSRIAQALLTTTSDELLLAVRADDQQELVGKTVDLERRLGPQNSDRVTVVPVNLTDRSPLQGVDPARPTHIIHAAAATQFNIDRDKAEAVVAGTARVAEFAAECHRLERFVALSTLYAVGKVQGTVEESHGPAAEFVNNYEWSKWAAEEELLQPWAPDVVIARMPTVIADDETGKVSQYNAFHNTMRLYYYGLMSIVPGDPSTPLTIATAEFAVSAVLALLHGGAAPGVYHVCPDAAGTVTLGTAIERAFKAFSADEGFRKRGLLAPVVCDRESFDDAVAVAAGMRGGPVHQALGSVTPFAEQLYQPKYFDNQRLRAVWPDYYSPDPVALVESVCLDLSASRWGRNSKDML